MSSLLDEALYGDDSSEVARIVWWIHQELLVTYEDYLALQAWFLHLVFAFDRVALSDRAGSLIFQRSAFASNSFSGYPTNFRSK